MKLSEELLWRGFYKQTTLKNPSELDNKKYTVYLGADPTGDSLHVGHLAVYMLVRRFLEHGHEVVLLIGGGTGIIGDPGGRDDERQLQSIEQISANTTALSSQVQKLFGDKQFTLVNNYDWLKNLTVIDFLRNTGKHFSMTQLVDRDYIATRMGEGGSGISYAEFSYTLLQGYDFLHLYKNNNVNFQIGGSDQWGNILSGVDLIRKVEGAEVDGMTAPLVIDKSTGKKFGKSFGGAIWLDPSKTSPYKFYQFWLGSSDEAVIDYLKLFTLLNKEEIDAIESEHFTSPEKRVAQKRLASEITDLVHSKKRREEVEHVTEVLFGGQNINNLNEGEIKALAGEIPTAVFGDVSNILVETKTVSSLGEARRLISGGGVSVDGKKISEDESINQLSLIKKGKNNFILVQ